MSDPFTYIPTEAFEAMVSALRAIAEQQQKTLEMLRSHEIVFNDIGNDPGNWQHVAFSIYTDLCEIDMIARNALGTAGVRL